jgi:hypothetical protein
MTTPMTPVMDEFENMSLGDIFEATDGQSGENTTSPVAENDGENAAIPGAGPLLEEPDASKVFKMIDDEVFDQERLAKNRLQSSIHWKRIKKGVPFCYLEKSEDQAVYRAVMAPGVEDVQQPIPNKVADLCGKQVSQILVDPPLPNPKADGDSQENRSATDLAKRFLRADGDVRGTNDMELFRSALTMNRTDASSFAFVWVDDTAGGWRPMQKLAHPQATDPKRPMYGPMLDKDGQPIVRDDGTTIDERTTDPILRYVGDEHDENDEPTGNEIFVANAAEAKREWLPKHRVTLLPPSQCRTLPPTADIGTASGVILLMFEPLGQAKRRFPALAAMDDDEIRQIAEWRPRRWREIVPLAQRPISNSTMTGKKISDSTLIFWYHRFENPSADYPDGAEIAVNGGAKNNQSAYIFKRDTLREDVEDENGSLQPILMKAPVAQFRAVIDTDDGDPNGIAPISAFGGANETRAHLFLAALNDIDIRLNPNVFLTSASEVTKEDMNRRDGTPIDVLTKDDMPVYEKRDALPPELPIFLERVDHDMDTAANLNQTAQALDSEYSESGEAKKVAIRQAKVQLAQEWQGFINGVLQYWQIKLQLAQAKLKTPQLVRLSGQNSAYKARHFVGADMLGVSTVTLAPGSGTMMSPAEKAQYLAQFQNMKWIDQVQAGELARSSMADDLGLEPNAHEEHMDRCIADWLDGPPDGWDEQMQAAMAFPQQMQAYQQSIAPIVQQLVASGMDQQTAMAQIQQTQPAPQQPPEPWTPFEARANDEEPIVAQVQYPKLSKLMSTAEYAAQPAPWRALVDKRYKQAAFAAGVETKREQQEAQQQAAMAGQQQDNKNAPPTWNDFVAKITQASIAAAAAEVAKVVEGVNGIATGAGKGAETEAPEPDDTALQLHHASMEAERDRQHELNMAAHTHQANLEAKQVDHAADAQKHAIDRAHEASMAATESPRPLRPI